MMKKNMFGSVMPVMLILVMAGCEGIFGPDKSGEIQLSSQLFGNETYYIYGYAYDQGEFYRYPFKGEPEPDIVNEAFRVFQGGELTSLPGFNTPGQVNGFALVGEFASQEDARIFYDDYFNVEEGLQFETVSDTVELYQVWVQKTSIGNYVKLLVKDIEIFQGEAGDIYNEVTLDYTYQPNGSTEFPK
jgi:hypothetical protein